MASFLGLLEPLSTGHVVHGLCPFLQGLGSTKETAGNAGAGLFKPRLGGAPDTAAGAGREGRISEIMKVAQRIPKTLDQRFCPSLTHKSYPMLCNHHAYSKDNCHLCFSRSDWNVGSLSHLTGGD